MTAHYIGLSLGLLSYLSLSSRQPSSHLLSLYSNFVNETGYSDGIAWILDLLQSALLLIGYDVVMHMTKEIPMVSRFL